MLFHQAVNGRRAKNFIPAIHVDGHVIADQHGKEDAFYQAYKEQLGRDTVREHTLDLDYLGITPIDLSEQDLIFQEEEIWKVINDMPLDRALGPDGFIAFSTNQCGALLKGM